jgi:hypothetical protein
VIKSSLELGQIPILQLSPWAEDRSPVSSIYRREHDLLSKFLYFKIFLIWMICNPYAVVFGLATVTAVTMGSRIAIHPQIQPKPSLERELGEIETHLNASDLREQLDKEEFNRRVTEMNQSRDERRMDTDKYRQATADLFVGIKNRFDADENDQRILRERSIGDEKLVFGFCACIAFLGGANFLKKYFVSRATLTVAEVREIRAEEDQTLTAAALKRQQARKREDVRIQRPRGK